MAEIFLDGDVVDVVFGPLERAAALMGDVRFSLDQVASTSVAVDPFSAVRGIRAPGFAVPGIVALGTWRSRRHGRSIVAAYRHRPAVVVEVDGQGWQRIVVSADEAVALAHLLRR